MKIDRILSIAGMIFLVMAFSLIRNTSTSSGYEVSIYSAYPGILWVLLIATVACGITIVVHQAFTDRKSHLWLVGLGMTLLANTVLLLLPEFREYPFYGRWDTATHLGYVKDILTTGNVGNTNFYPVEHILGAIIVHVAGIPREALPSLFFVLFSGFYIVSMYILGKTVSHSRGQTLLILAFALPLVYSFFHAAIHPSVLALFMMPCMLALYHKTDQSSKNRVANSLILILLALAITFFHPITAIFAILVLCVFGIPCILHNYRNAWAILRARLSRQALPQIDPYVGMGERFLGVTLIMTVTFFTWYLSYSLIRDSFKRVYQWLVFESGTSLIRTDVTTIQESGLSFLQTVRLVMTSDGAILILLVISGASFLYMLSRGLSKEAELAPTQFSYAIQFVVALPLGIVMVFGNFPEYEYNPVRLVRLALLMGTVLSGLATYDFIKSRWGQGIGHQGILLVASVIVILIVVAAISMGSVFSSSWTYSPSAQMTYTEIYGGKWFETTKNPEIPVVASASDMVNRLTDYNFGVDSSAIPRSTLDDPPRLPSHFGYDQYTTLAESFERQQRYALISDFGKLKHQAYPKVAQPKVHQWTEEDFLQLGTDSTTAKLYCNTGFEVWTAYGGNE